MIVQVRREAESSGSRSVGKPEGAFLESINTPTGYIVRGFSFGELKSNIALQLKGYTLAYVIQILV